MQLKLGWLFILSVVGAVALGVSFPFTGGMFPLVFIGFVPLLIINIQLNKQKRLKGLLRFLLNYIFFVIFNFITTWWIYYASAEGMYMAVFANALLMVVPFYFGAFIMKQMGENKGLIGILVLWLTFEYGHYHWELSWPWLNLGHVFGNHPMLIQWYEYSGVLGGTFWVLVVNIFIYLIVRNLLFNKESWKIQTPIVLFTILALIIPVSSSLFIYYNYEEKKDPVDIVVCQPNIEAHFEKFYTPWQNQLTKMFQLAEPLVDKNVDLVACPETAINIGLDEAHLADEIPMKFVESFQRVKDSVPVMIGAFTQAFFRTENSPASRKYGNTWYEDYNTAVMMNFNMPLQIYHKSKLVLGSEKLPFVGMLPFLKDYSVELGGTAGLLGVGEEPMLVEASGIKFAPIICYESVYGEYVTYFTRKGAEIITVITNDGWWQTTAGHKQHRMFSQIRAIENRRSVARSANTGISCFIDQRGEIIEEIPYGEAGAIRKEINRNDYITFYVKYGDIFGRISLFLALGLFLFSMVIFLKSKGIRTS